MSLADAFVRFLEKLGGKTVEVAEVPKRIPRRRPIQERLKILREIQREEEREAPSREEEELERLLEARREEISKPFSQRLAEAFLNHFRGPVESMTRSLKGLEYDLYRANIRMSKEMYVAMMLVAGIFLSVFSFVASILMGLDIITSILVGIFGFLAGFMYLRVYPRMVWRRRVSEVEKALPYVLRHLAALLSAGVGIAEAMVSVANSDYGVASEEFELMVRDMRSGASFEDALMRFDKKMESENVTRVVKQILRAIKFGGNLADILYDMAADFAFEYRMKLVEYVQKVNGISFVYMFLTVVMPTMFVVAILAGSAFASAGSGGLAITPAGLAAILLLGFPMISLIIIVMIKRGEPR
ncbi:MAG: type II secretion system F family protein [Thermococci archaeon]|nr:type II secretion system F family protein [Thermococci archaeon]